MPDKAGSKQKRDTRIAADIARVEAMSDEEIDLSDMPEVTEEQWARSRRGEHNPRSGEEITLELDADVIEWFKQHENDYETAINAALRKHVESRLRVP